MRSITNSKRLGSRPSKSYPQPLREQVDDLQQLDLKGSFYLSDSSQKYYLLALRDFVSKRVALSVAKDHKVETVATFLVQAWQRIGLPQVLQMDNGLGLRGSNRYPPSLGKVVRICLNLGVEPCFVPPKEPWHNGFIEHCNGLVGRLLLKPHTIANFVELLSCVKNSKKPSTLLIAWKHWTARHPMNSLWDVGFSCSIQPTMGIRAIFNWKRAIFSSFEWSAEGAG